MSRISVQLYTLRNAIQQDLEGVLVRLSQAGFTQVEPFDIMAYPDLGSALSHAGLSAPTAHVHMIGESDERVDAIFDAALRSGIQTVIDPYREPSFWATRTDIEHTATLLNALSERAFALGLAVGYHNHAHEFETTLDGRYPLEILAESAHPDVQIELDTYWAAVAGANPADILTTMGARVTALHIKDGPITHNDSDQVAVGSGSMPIRDIIKAAPNALRVIELDDYRGDPFDAVTESLRFLEQEGVA